MINRLVGLPLASSSERWLLRPPRMLKRMARFLPLRVAEPEWPPQDATLGDWSGAGTVRTIPRRVQATFRISMMTTTPSRKPARHDRRSSRRPLSLPLRQQCRSQASCSNCRAIIGCDSQITASCKPSNNPANRRQRQHPSRPLQSLLPTLPGLKPRNLLASFHPPSSSFATGIKRKSENIQSWPRPYTPARTIGTADRGPARFKLLTWTFPKL